MIVIKIDSFIEEGIIDIVSYYLNKIKRRFGMIRSIWEYNYTDTQ